MALVTEAYGMKLAPPGGGEFEGPSGGCLLAAGDVSKLDANTKMEKRVNTANFIKLLFREEWHTAIDNFTTSITCGL